MSEHITPPADTPLLEAAAAWLSGERHPLVNGANLAALLYHTLADCNWAGFYFLHEGGLVLGPFQGKPACTRIALGRGVCGTAAASRLPQRVPDVHAFPGHIACDSASRSELVIPICLGGRLLGVLDLDSPHVNRFSEQDLHLLEALVVLYARACDWTQAGYSLT